MQSKNKNADAISVNPKNIWERKNTKKKKNGINYSFSIMNFQNDANFAEPKTKQTKKW